MSITELVAAIFLLCGPAEDCWHYYNNCVHNKSATLQRENMLLCQNELNKNTRVKALIQQSESK